ncbi:unnamed protein product, partial [marine sediment metagenome]
RSTPDRAPTVIFGNWVSRRVHLGVRELLPDASQRICNHSPDGFNWGYAGSGPAQLALAILLDMTEDRAFSLSHHQAFKEQVIANLPRGDFRLSFQIVGEWVNQAGGNILPGKGGKCL